MENEIIKLINFIVDGFLQIWPYIIITIPLAVAINMSGASKYIKKAFEHGPIIAILLATLIGAFSPFCSCGVIPIIAALLISGVPLAPVMAFWIASPSMDPEIFFLSVGTIGMELAIWRLAGTMAMSIGAGFITHLLTKSNWIGNDILKNKLKNPLPKKPALIKRLKTAIVSGYREVARVYSISLVPAQATGGCGGNLNCSLPNQEPENTEIKEEKECCSSEPKPKCGCGKKQSLWERIVKESFTATKMVLKFMAIAFFLEALIIFYVPEEWITQLMGIDNPFAILVSAIIGIPVYTSNLSALPMVAGLIEQGMSPAAGLAFLIAGPTTTLPAMAAVWTLVKRRIFILYVAYSLLGAILLGYLYQAISLI